MKVRLIVALSALLAAGGIAPARANNGAASEQLQGTYGRMVDAYNAKDMKTLLALHTPDFSVRRRNGQTLSRRQVESDLKRQLAEWNSFDNLSLKVRKLTVTGNRAVAIRRMTSTRTVTDAKGKSHRVTENSITRDLWTKTSGGWKMRRVEELERKITKDGKPFSP